MQITITSLSELPFIITELAIALGIVTIIHELGHMLIYLVLEKSTKFRFKLSWFGVDFYYTASKPMNTLLISLAGVTANALTLIIFLPILPQDSYIIQLTYLMIFVNLLPIASDGKAIIKSSKEIFRSKL
jgi:hypothetical protein